MDRYFHASGRMAASGLVAMAVAAALVSAGATAAETTEAETKAVEELDEVQITGSRIVRRDLNAPTPIITIEAEAFEESSNISLEATLNELPQFNAGAFGGGAGLQGTQFDNSNVTPSATSTPGQATANLRGLGANRTLVLIDGRRGMPANASLTVDISSIPSAALQSVEIISGGASAVYGADAMGGVTNFKLRDNYRGASLTARGGMSEAGDGEEWRIGALLGASIAEGRGNAMLSIDWTGREPQYRLNRKRFQDSLFDPTASALSLARFNRPSYEVLATAGNVPYRGGGVITGNRPSQAALNTLFDERPAGVTIAPTTALYFNTDGTLFTTSNGGLGWNSGDLTSGRYKINSNNTLVEQDLESQMSSPSERFTMFGRAKYSLTDNLRIFTQAMFMTNEVLSRQQPSPASADYGAAIPHGSQVYVPSRLGNGNTHPDYLAGGKYGLSCPATGGCTLSQAFPVSPELAAVLASRTNSAACVATNDTDVNTNQARQLCGPNSAWRLGQTLTFMPPRSIETNTQTYQFISGLEGDLGISDWTWEAYVSHGETRNYQNYLGHSSTALYRLIAQSPNFGRNLVIDGTLTQPLGVLRNKRLSCTSGLPIFSDFQISQDCIDAISIDMVDRTELSQQVYEANFQGGLFELPAGEVRSALGLSYRVNDFKFTPDSLRDLENVQDVHAGGSVSAQVTGMTSVKEVYGELLVPVLRDLPLIRSFDLEFGYRQSEYNTDAGSSATYKALFSWELVDYFRLRGGFNRANRAPNIAELFTGATNVVVTVTDPCRSDTGLSWGNRADNPNRAQVQALCAGIIGPGSVFDDDPTNFVVGGSNFGIQQGNTALQTEKGETVTLGFVMRSPFEQPLLAGTTLSVDYYTAKITEAISVIPAQTVYELCFNADGNSNPGYSLSDPSGMCGRIVRDPASGAMRTVETPYANLGVLEVSGIDAALNWRAALADMGSDLPGSISLGVNYSRPLEYKQQNFPTEPLRNYVGTSNTPMYRMTTTARYSFGRSSVGLNWRFQPSVNSGAAVSDPNTTFVGSGSYSLFSLSGSHSFGRRLQLSAGIDNLFDKDPPRYSYVPETSTGLGTALSGADPQGRRYFLNARMDF